MLHNSEDPRQEENKQEPLPRSGSQISFFADQKKRVQILADNISVAIDEYEKGRKVPEHRLININHLKTQYLTGASKKFTDADALAEAVHTYITGDDYKKGFFDGSVLKRKIVAKIKEEHPLLLIKSAKEKSHYEKMKADFLKASLEFDRSSQRIDNLNMKLEADKSIINDLRSCLETANALNDELLGKPNSKSVLQARKSKALLIINLTKSIILLEKQKTDIEKELKDEKTLKKQLESQLEMQKKSLKQADIIINKGKERLAILEAMQKPHLLLLSHKPSDSTCRQEATSGMSNYSQKLGK
jgi:hypothetical protein